jgi:CRP-like cAMP-binding protein
MFRRVRHGPLAALPRTERRALKRFAEPLDYPAGKELVSEGKLADSLFFIERGEVSVIGRQGRLARLGENDFFGEVALMTQRPRTASVVADTDVRLRVITRDEFVGAMRTLPTFAGIVRSAAEERLAKSGID